MRPRKISASRSRGLLLIDWEDGHHSDYPLAGLRAACPCAECRGGHEGMGKRGSPEMLEIPLAPAGSRELDHMQGVGNYALQLVWADGHAYGIYTWEYLRELCPCGEDP
ncbi:MAG: gamma-butyrobetaine hydroxylase-like domain-containing protein [Anaerolineales bacterium]